VILVSLVLALALLASNLSEARFVYMVLDLMARHGNLVAAVASNRFVTASFTVLFNHCDVQIVAATVFAIYEGSLTALLNVLLKVVHGDSFFFTAVWALELGVREDLTSQEMDLSRLAKNTST